MSALLAAGLLAALSAIAVALLRRTRGLTGEVARLSARLDELAARLESAEQDLAQAATSAEVAESLLVEKGIADEEEVEDARRRFGGATADPVRPREGELH
jgi:predicted  nucleic acid-binding Zn-ribbon protein